MSVNENQSKGTEEESKKDQNYFSNIANQIVCKHFRLTEKMFGGCFGELWLAEHIDNNSYAAVKIELKCHTCAQLDHEHKMYKIVGKHQGIPEIYGLATLGKFNLLVMELLGPSLQDIFELYDHRFSLETVGVIGLQILDLIEFIHSKNIIYRDIKPENFLTGRDDQQHVIHLIDFGLAKLYTDRQTNEHIPFKMKGTITGTPRFMSINANLGNEQSRRDDLEAIGYMLIYFLNGKLLWQNIESDSWTEKLNTIARIKEKTSVKKICANLPEEVASYLIYVRKLNFTQEPSYGYLRNLLQVLSKRKLLDHDFDWFD